VRLAHPGRPSPRSSRVGSGPQPDTHIAEVNAELGCHEARDPCGHSYGGMVITGPRSDATQGGSPGLRRQPITQRWRQLLVAGPATATDGCSFPAPPPTGRNLAVPAARPRPADPSLVPATRAATGAIDTSLADGGIRHGLSRYPLHDLRHRSATNPIWRSRATSRSRYLDSPRTPSRHPVD